jgi:hypothetical protein
MAADGRESFMTSLDEHSRCLTCRTPIAAGERCCCIAFQRKDGARIHSFLCVGCARVVGVATQLGG